MREEQKLVRTIFGHLALDFLYERIIHKRQELIEK